MNIFEKAIEDIFNVNDLCDECIINGLTYKCICSSMTNDVVYSGIGKIDDVNFILSIRLPVNKLPKVGDKLKYKNKDYKISDMEVDSANTSVSIHLESLAKG